MLIIAVILFLACGLLYREYSAKSRRVKQLEDAIDIAHSTTGFLYTFNAVSKIYKAAYDGEHTVDLDSANELLSNLLNHGRYWQVYSDVEGINEIRKYQGFGLAGNNFLQELLDRISEEEIEEPETYQDWVKELKKHFKPWQK